MSLVNDIFQSSGDLEEELKRVSAENKRLTEMLTEMCENYNALRNHISEYMRKNNGNNNINNDNSEKEMSPPKKRKSDQNSNPIGVYGSNNNSESSSTDEEESSKKPRHEIIKAKISKVYVRTPISDTTLVSHNTLHLFIFINTCDLILVSMTKCVFLFMFSDCERWISVEEIWAKGHKRQPLPKSLLQMLFCPLMPCQKEGN